MAGTDPYGARGVVSMPVGVASTILEVGGGAPVYLQLGGLQREGLLILWL